MEHAKKTPIAVEDLGETTLAELQRMTGDRGGRLLLSLQRREGLWVVAFVVPREGADREFVCEDLATAMEDAVVDFMARHVRPKVDRAARA